LSSSRRLGYAIFFVSDVERSVRFYRDTIGLPFRFANESYAEFATEGAKFALFARSALPELIGGSASDDRVPFPQGEVAFFVDDVDGEHARLLDAGVEILMPPTDRPWGERTLHVADPDGNVVELTRPKRRPARPTSDQG
jgi:lactoylglutathione lyase